MQNEKSQYLIPIPAELFEEAGLDALDGLQMHTDGCRLIIEQIDTDDFVCDKNCEDCIFNEGSICDD